jgi:glycosyltransferase involved in cell wall biosynthesis
MKLQPVRITKHSSGFLRSSGAALSVCITSLNDNEEAANTVKSIRDTAGDIEIVLIDDHSDVPLSPPDKSVILYRTAHRLGVGPSRDLAVSMATKSHVLITDAHMRFEEGWLEKLNPRLDDKTIWNATCLGLSETNMDLTKYHGAYHGARLALLESEASRGKVNDVVFEGKWIGEKPGDNYDISCMMGATYIFPVRVYRSLGGLGVLKHWGSDEPYMSAKAWLSGYEVRMAKDVRIGHKFRKNAPYTSDIWCMTYNKLRAIAELFGPDWMEKFVPYFPKNQNTVRAMDNLRLDWDDILACRNYYTTEVFKHDMDWLCDRFAIAHPKNYARPNIANRVQKHVARPVAARVRRSGPNAGGIPGDVGKGVPGLLQQQPGPQG